MYRTRPFEHRITHLSAVRCSDNMVEKVVASKAACVVPVPARLFKDCRRLRRLRVAYEPERSFSLASGVHYRESRAWKANKNEDDHEIKQAASRM